MEYLDDITKHFEEEYPREGCGILSVVKGKRVWNPCTNLAKNEEGIYRVNPKAPTKGWKAYFVELTYETSFGIPLKFTTPVRVVPNTLPFEYQPPKISKKGFLSK